MRTPVTLLLLHLLLLLLLLLLLRSSSAHSHQHDECKIRFLSHPITPTRSSFNVTNVALEIASQLSESRNFSLGSRRVLSSYSDVSGLALSKSEDERVLAMNINSRLKIFPNRTAETEVFWKAFDGTSLEWGKPFKDCNFFLDSWFYIYVYRVGQVKVGVFVGIQVDQCDDQIQEIFGSRHKCDDTQTCVVEADVKTEKSGHYKCKCKAGYFYPGVNSTWTGIGGIELESGAVEPISCQPCPKTCPYSCGLGGFCLVQHDVYLRTIVLCVQLFSMGVVVVLSFVVFKHRKTKAIATGMWTILETILLGIFILYNTVVIRIFRPSITRCLLEPWIREIGFIICYGAVILKLYRHLIEFRTRKAHRWVVKDTDLLKYLLIMILSGLAYMAAYTAITLNFMQENYSLLYIGRTMEEEYFETCKYLWWDYVTEAGELAILVFGIHLAYASRNARTQFHERSFLCAAISLELAVSIVFYTSRVLILHELHPDIVLIIYTVRTQFSQTVALVLIFLPKFWYQQKQVRSLAQEYSCRFPLDAFKDPPSHGRLSGNNSDVEIGEISIADMSPDDIRAELKRLYLQLEMFKTKTMCRDNPHISKRRGGRKAQHRRFSLQKKGSREKVRRTMSLHARHKDKEKRRENETEITEAEPSRTPEDSVCSTEGPSAIYADLASTNQIN